MNKIKIQAKVIDAGGGIYLYSTESIACNFRYPNSFEAVMVNGLPPSYCEGDSKYFIANKSDNITVKTRDTSKHIGYILTNSIVESDKIPLRIPLGLEVEKEDGELDFAPPYNGIRGLYENEYQKIDGNVFELDIEPIIIATSNNIPVILKPIPALLPTDSYGWTKNDHITSATSGWGWCASVKSPNIGEIERIVLPKVLHSEVPCSLNSQQVYGIVRKFIKENINGKYARITSDYDFCFTVQKVIPILKPYSFRSVWNTGSKKRPKYAIIDCKEKLIPVFEMTNEKDKYKGYTAIGGLSAENERDLNKQVDDYCLELITAINEPLVECNKCGGYGFHVDKLPLIQNRKQ